MTIYLVKVHVRAAKMKLSTPEIVWHSKEPIYTADFHKNGPKWRLATGGADNDIKIWKVMNELDGVKIYFLANLSRHTKAVNIVRFAPNGEYLASAGDGKSMSVPSYPNNVLFLWSRDVGTEPVENNLLTGCQGNKENWNVVKVLRGHLEDIYDLSWSHDSCYIVTGSVDNSAIIWDIQKGQQLSCLKDSRQYVQGVSWDPLGKYVVTLSNDRNLRVYGIENKFKCLHSVSKFSLPDQDGESKQWKMWIDERLNSFFRRLSFTPDGSFLIAPAGRFELSDQSKNATYVFGRNNWSRPVLQLPGSEKPTVVVKCCPIPFVLKPQTNSLLTSLPYRLVFAVASLDSILFYDTQHSTPFAHVSNIHYSGITDMAWSNDGLMLIVTSSDCYCSIITFESSELGDPLETSVMFPTAKCEKASQPVISQAIPHSEPDHCSAPPQVVSPTGKQRRIRPTMISAIVSETTMASPHSKDQSPDVNISKEASQIESTSISTEPVTPPVTQQAPGANKKIVPRRVNLITLASFNKSSSVQTSVVDERTNVNH